MDSNMGSQEYETIAKFMDDIYDTAMEVADNEGGRGAVPDLEAANINVAMQDSQTSSQFKTMLKAKSMSKLSDLDEST